MTTIQEQIARAIEQVRDRKWTFGEVAERSLASVYDEVIGIIRDFGVVTPINLPGYLPESCVCPNDCGCEGELVCGIATPGKTLHRCQLPAGHPGWHVHHNHRWETPCKHEPTNEW